MRERKFDPLAVCAYWRKVHNYSYVAQHFGLSVEKVKYVIANESLYEWERDRAARRAANGMNDILQ